MSENLGSNEVLIAGGGLSGLTLAYELRRAGFEPLIADPAGRPGGITGTIYSGGFTVETGADSFLASKPAALELVRELGIEHELITTNESRRRIYILRDGELVPMPHGLSLFAPRDLAALEQSGLIRDRARVRAELGYPAGDYGERTVAEFVADHYGEEVLDYIAEPLLAGVYGGDPAQLSASAVLGRYVELERSYGSITRGLQAEDTGAAPVFRSFRRGMGTLIDALIAATSPRFVPLGAKPAAIACPAYAAAEFVDPVLAQHLRGIPYSSAATVAMGYRREDVAHPLDGFGFLVPRKERRMVLACTWVSSKFDGRAPENHVLLRCFTQDLSRSDDQLVVACHSELEAILGVRREPVLRVVSRWPRSMPQYTIGHEKRVAEIFGLARRAGVYLAGNAYEGVGVPDTIRRARTTARELITSLRSRLR